MRITAPQLALTIVVVGFALMFGVFVALSGSWMSALWIVGNLILAIGAFGVIIMPVVDAYVKWRHPR